MIAEGRVLWRGNPAKASQRVINGEKIIIRYPAREDPPARHASLPIIYEDEMLLAVNKPGDILSHPTDKLLNNSATAILGLQFPGRRLHLAHRLDRETSGVLLFAKNLETARKLGEQFFNREIGKEYQAIVIGRVHFLSKTVDRPLGYEEDHVIRVRQKVMEPGQGLPAKTGFKRLAAAEKASLLRAVPKTGRLHQIRVHLAWLGHPVVGDKLYVGDGESYLKAWRGEEISADALGALRQMLHARKMEIIHPGTGKKLRLEAPLPEDFVECLKRAELTIP